MNENRNDPFPPVSQNGTANKTGRANGPKRVAKPNSRPTNQTADNAKRPQLTTKSEKATNQRGHAEHGQQPTPPDKAKPLTPAQLLSAKVSGYVARYPWQSIGGLLGVLLVILLFKTFYQSKNWKAERMAEEAYYVANQYARNNGTNLYPYLSQAFRREVRLLPGLLPLSMQTATRGGSITGAESIGLREITPDSVVVEVLLTFENRSGATTREEKRYQPLVYEKDQWRLGLAYNR